MISSGIRYAVPKPNLNAEDFWGYSTLLPKLPALIQLIVIKIRNADLIKDSLVFDPCF